MSLKMVEIQVLRPYVPKQSVNQMTVRRRVVEAREGEKSDRKRSNTPGSSPPL